MNDQQKDDELGVMWNGKGGRSPAFTGKLTSGGMEARFVVFPNNKKTRDAQPDYRILKARPKPQEEAPF